MKRLCLYFVCCVFVGTLAGRGLETNELAGLPEKGAFVLNGDAARGRLVFGKNCVACHGPTGDGQGPLAQAFDPRPGNLTALARDGADTDKYLYTIISEGGPSVGKCMEMGAWQNSLTDQAIRDVAAYVKTLSASPRPAKSQSEFQLTPIGPGPL